MSIRAAIPGNERRQRVFPNFSRHLFDPAYLEDHRKARKWVVTGLMTLEIGSCRNRGLTHLEDSMRFPIDFLPWFCHVLSIFGVPVPPF